MITEEDFEAWRENPVTKSLLGILADMVQDTKNKWDAVAWVGGSADPLLLADLRARAEVLVDMIEISFADMEHKLDKSEQDSTD